MWQATLVTTPERGRGPREGGKPPRGQRALITLLLRMAESRAHECAFADPNGAARRPDPSAACQLDRSEVSRDTDSRRPRRQSRARRGRGSRGAQKRQSEARGSAKTSNGRQPRTNHSRRFRCVSTESACNVTVTLHASESNSALS